MIYTNNHQAIGMGDTARIFTTGRSQAVRLPREYRFEGTEVFIRRDPRTGDVILSRRPTSWSGFFELIDQQPAPADFLSPEDRRQGTHTLDPFA
jgi:antitoxin VapB